MIFRDKNTLWFKDSYHTKIVYHLNSIIRSHVKRDLVTLSNVNNSTSCTKSINKILLKKIKNSWINYVNLISIKVIHFNVTMAQEQTHRKFILAIAFFQAVVIALFCVFVRYDQSLDSLYHANRTNPTEDSVMDTQYHSKFSFMINSHEFSKIL